MINIKREDFKKLSQLDRIEFILRKKSLEDSRIQTGKFYFLNQGFYILGFIILLSLSAYNIIPSMTFRLLYLIAPILKVFLSVFLILCVLDLIDYILYKKKLKELLGDYFKIERKNGK